jgi:hypothetical protein
MPIFEAYYFCTYSGCLEKNLIKTHLNTAIRNYFQEHEITYTANQHAHHKKPVILIVFEQFSSTHAMFRCFSSAIGKLKNYFHVVGLFFTQQNDDSIQDTVNIINESIYFPSDSVHHLPWSEQIRQLCQKLQGYHFDMVFYPSIGMHHYAIALSNIRLAAIQVMAYGHPASSFSPMIDYGILEDDFFSTSGETNEKLILVRKESAYLFPLANINSKTINIEKTQPGPIRIVVSANAFKLSYPFLLCCQQIAKRAKRPIQMIFLCGLRELYHLHCHKTITEMIPNSRVYPYLNFDDYLQILTTCDMALTPFPFGGTNTIIDLITYAIPIVILRGNDLSSCADATLWQRYHLPEWLISSTTEDYVKCALRLLSNDEERIQIRKEIYHKVKSLREGYTHESTESPHDYAHVFMLLHTKNDLLRHNKNKVIHFTDLAQL